MSYADRLQKLVEYQTNIRSALEAKGATISSDATLKDFPSAVDTITGDYTGPTPVDFVENGMGVYVSMMSGATKIREYAFYEDPNITEAIFPNASIIGDYAFYGASNISTISFPNTVSIKSYAFSGLTKISQANFPKCQYLGHGAFYRCSSLVEVSFPELVNGNTNGSFFVYCSKLTFVELPKYNISYLNGIFSGCTLLRTVSLPAFTGYFSFYTFNSCYNLTEVFAPLTTGVSGACFSSCSSLTLLSFPNLQTIYASGFTNAVALTKLYLLSDVMVKLSSANAFYSTPISSSSYKGYFGSVFVKYGLLDAYKASTNWVNYADRIGAVVPFSATNLSESDSITTFVEGKESPIPLEVPSTEFTYSVYSKYPKYTGTQADVDENGEINITLPNDGVTLTINTTPEDATVKITEDGIADIYAKTKVLNGGDIIDYEVLAEPHSVDTYYKALNERITIEQDTVIDVKLEERHIDTVTLPEITHYPEEYADIFGNNMFEAYNTTQLRTSEKSGQTTTYFTKYFIYNTLAFKSNFKAKIKRDQMQSYENYIGMHFTINKVLDEATYGYRDLQKELPVTDSRIYDLYLKTGGTEYDINVELEPNTTYYVQFLVACYSVGSLGSGCYGYITDMTLYYDGGPVE